MADKNATECNDGESRGETANPYRKSGVVTADEEVWICDQIRLAINVARAAESMHGVGADDRVVEQAVEGAINGAALEIINTLGLETEGANLDYKLGRDNHLIYSGDPDE
jgi:hypothetical protein